MNFWKKKIVTFLSIFYFVALLEHVSQKPNFGLKSGTHNMREVLSTFYGFNCQLPHCLLIFFFIFSNENKFTN